MKQGPRRDGSTGGGHKPVFSVAGAAADEREPLVPRSLNEGRGFRARMTPQSKWCVIELDIQADPRKDEKWAAEMRATIGEQRFQREYLRNWTLSTNSPFFPEYQARGGDDTFVRKIESVGRGPLYVGLDFGVRNPAVVVGQPNQRKTRLYLMREWMPSGIQAVPFMEVVEWLLGELPKSLLSPEALVWVVDLERKAAEGRGPAVPWFKDPPQVLRFTSQEALRTSQEVAAESRERRLVDIWQARGFPLTVHYAQVKGGSDVLRHLMRTPKKDSLPYLVVDPWCKLVREGLGGGYTFKRPTREDPIPADPVKDGHYEHTQDCIRYIASNAIDMKAIDDGKPDNMSLIVDAGTVSKASIKARVRDEYDRSTESDDDAAGFSTVYSTGSPRGTYTRGE